MLGQGGGGWRRVGALNEGDPKPELGSLAGLGPCVDVASHAGHQFPADGQSEAGSPELLGGGGVFLGAFPDLGTASS